MRRKENGYHRFLIADELMQQSVYTILHIYKDKLEAHDITTTVTIIDFPISSTKPAA